MDTRNTGNILSQIFTTEDGIGDMLDMIKNVDSSLNSSFLPSVMVKMPQSYLTRDKRRVDLCGMVAENTDEYKEGYRYFSTEGEFFYQDGKCSQGENNPCDLVSLIDQDNLSNTNKPVSPYWWVHPQHWVITTWFTPLTPGRTEVQVGSRYLCQMGLVVEIIGTKDHQGVTYFRDHDDRFYRADGRRYGSDGSMFDLRALVRHWDMFVEQDWSSDKGISKKAAPHVAPEMFDPTGGNSKELMRRFLNLIADANELAAELGIKLGFTMDSAGTGN